MSRRSRRCRALVGRIGDRGRRALLQRVAVGCEGTSPRRHAGGAHLDRLDFELIDGRGRRAVTSAAIIPSGQRHAIRIPDPTTGVMIFLDPSAFTRAGTDSEDVAEWVMAGDELSCWTTALPPERLLET